MQEDVRFSIYTQRSRNIDDSNIEKCKGIVKFSGDKIDKA